MTDIQYISADGLELFAKAYGPSDAPLTVLCMHGLTRNHLDFEPMISALGEDYRFLVVDVRGRGRSARSSDPDTYTPAVYAQDMIALLDHMKIDKVALIGTSMGGLMAMLMARMAGDRIRAVVLNDIGPKVERAGLARIAAYAGKGASAETWTHAASLVAEQQSVAFPDYTDPDWLAFARRTWREHGDGQILPDYDPAIMQAGGAAKSGPLTNFAMWRLFGALKCYPLLVIRGETSDVLSAKTARRMVRRHPDAALVTIPARGHAPMLDEPEAVSAISSFLKQVEASQ